MGLRAAITTNEPENVSLLLLVMVHMGLLIRVFFLLAPSRLPNVQDTGCPPTPPTFVPNLVPFAKENPEPVTATRAPLPAALGVSVIVPGAA